MKIVIDTNTGKQYQARTPQQHPLFSDIEVFKGERVFKLNVSTQNQFISILRERQLFNMQDILAEIDGIATELNTDEKQLMAFLSIYLTHYHLETGKAKADKQKNTGKKKKVRCVCVDTDEVLMFESAKECSLFLGYSPTTITNCIYGNGLLSQKRTNLRFFLEYIEEEQ